jgi:cytochrome c oxidase assembly factor CtaG
MIAIVAALFLACLNGLANAHVAAGGNLLTDWHWRWDVSLVLALFATLYLRGWLRLRTLGGEAKLWQLAFYALALGAIAAALLSPIDELASYLLIAHMVQHELLMMVAPPLILLANPVVFLMWGLGGSLRWRAGNLLAHHSITRRLRDFFGRMPIAWSVYVANLWAWHYPPLYEAALRDPWIHDLEHILFFLTALVFWWPVIRAASHPTAIQHGARIFYLFLAGTQDAVLSGLIGLSNKILYPHYETTWRLWEMTPQQDQIGGGLVMFGAGSLTYLIAILVLVNALLNEGKGERSTKRAPGHGADKVKGRV